MLWISFASLELRLQLRHLCAIACLTVGAVVLAGCGGASGGSLWSWGFSVVPYARQLDTPSGVTLTMIAVGAGNQAYGVALDTEGRAWGWGASVHGALGAAGVTMATPPGTATAMPHGVSFTTIATVGEHVVALDRSGRAWTWGRNSEGELGNGGTADSPTPAPVKMPVGVRFTRVATSFFDTYALDQNGGIWGWGGNDYGALGNGTVRHSGVSPANPTPVRVASPPGTHFVALTAAGSHGLALDATGRAWAWGDDSSGQLGVGVSADSADCRRFVGAPCTEMPTPVAMPAGVTFAWLGAGTREGYAIDTTGHAWAWGSNQWGQLGIGSTSGPEACHTVAACATIPRAVTMPARVRFVAMVGSNTHTVALDSSGALWGFGDNSNQQLGAKSASCSIDIVNTVEAQPCRTAPVRITAPSGMTFAQIGAVDGFTFALAGKPHV